jgi:hypothetical protein
MSSGHVVAKPGVFVHGIRGRMVVEYLMTVFAYCLVFEFT